jgi:hypothetical protein
VVGKTDYSAFSTKFKIGSICSSPVFESWKVGDEIPRRKENCRSMSAAIKACQLLQQVSQRLVSLQETQGDLPQQLHLQRLVSIRQHTSAYASIRQHTSATQRDLPQQLHLQRLADMLY